MLSSRSTRNLVIAAVAATLAPLRAIADSPSDVPPSPPPTSPSPSPASLPSPAPSSPPPPSFEFDEPAAAQPLPTIVVPPPTPIAPIEPIEPTAPTEPEPEPQNTPHEPIRRVRLAPNLGLLFGQTGYGLALTISGVGARSQLDYSLDTVTAGLDVAYMGGGNGARPWSLRLSANTNLSDPFGTLLDRDWFSLGGTETEFSHTDSRLTGRIVFADIAAHIAFAGWRRTHGVVADFIVGYRHEAIILDGWGVTGWQDAGGYMASVFLDPSVQVIHYESQRLLPYVGIGLRGPLFGHVVFDASAALALAVSIDRDDHVLRHKLLEATSTGVGFMLQFAPQWILIGSDAEHARLSLALDLQLRYLIATGTVHQHFYADDPTEPGDQRLEMIPDSAFTLTSLVGAIRATMDVRF